MDASLEQHGSRPHAIDHRGIGLASSPIYREQHH
jgi:hypothetical protein